MRNYLIIVAAFIILSSCEKNNFDGLYKEAWKTKDISKAKNYVLLTENHNEKANGNFMIAYIFKSQQQFDSAITYYSKAQHYYELSENIEWQAHTLKNIGNIHRENSNFKVAKEYYQRGLDLNSSLQINHEILLKIARCNWRIDEWALSYEQLDQCLKFFKGKDDYYAAEANLILGNISFDYALSTGSKQSLDEAFGHYFKAAKLYNKEEDKALAYNNIGNTYLELGKLGESRIYLDSALKVQTSQKEIAILNHNLGKWHLASEQFDSALFYFNSNIALTEGGTHEAQLSYKNMIDHYIRTGQTELALKMNTVYFDRNQELIEERERLIRKSKEQEYELSKSRDVILNQKKEQQNQLYVQAAIIAASILIIAFLSLYFIRYRKRITKVKTILTDM